MGSLYPIVDEETCQRLGLRTADVFAAVLGAKPDLIQLRAKKADDGATLALLRELVRQRDQLSPTTLVFANDRADLAELAGADGVHVGQDDMPLALVRKHFPRLKVGVSTHDQAQLQSAIREHPDYAAIGPIFATSSKENPEPTVGLWGLQTWAPLAHAKQIPVVAIGGIDLASLPQVLRYADRAATISALLGRAGELSDPKSEITRVARIWNAASKG